MPFALAEGPLGTAACAGAIWQLRLAAPALGGDPLGAAGRICALADEAPRLVLAPLDRERLCLEPGSRFEALRVSGSWRAPSFEGAASTTGRRPLWLG